MSGGYFDYQQYHINDIATKIERNLADMEYANSIGKVKKKEVYAHLINVDSGRKTYPYWLLEACRRYDNRDDFLKSLSMWCEYNEIDGKIYTQDRHEGLCEIVVTEGEVEEWADGKWHREIEDSEVYDEFINGLKIIKMASVYAHRIDWFLSGDDGAESFKERLKEELNELESKPLVDYEYWKQIFEEDFDE